MKIVIGESGGNKMRLQHQHVSILLAQPRRLYVYIQCAAMSCYGICLYALDAQSKPPEILQWWEETYAITHRLIPRDATVLCGIDGNLRVRQAAVPWTGHRLDPPGSSGTDEQLFLKFVRQLHGSVVNTHDANMHPESSNGTFRPTAGLDAVRCDYVVASLNVTVVPKSCLIDLRFLRHANGDDHLPMKVTVVLPGTARHAITKRCSSLYSRAAILQDMKRPGTL